MITDKDIARICCSSYDPNFKWDKLWDGASSGGIYVGLIGNVLCFRGSVTLEDWFRDLKAEAIIDPVLGGLHAGFAEGLKEFFAEVIQLLHRDTIVCGHSLGAARAIIFSAMMMTANLSPKAVIVFGCPRPGFNKLAGIMNKHECARAYKNRYDLVTDLPRALLGLPFMNALGSIPLNVYPPSEDYGLFADHHPELYAAGTPETVIA